jgi:hypothetical protein
MTQTDQAIIAIARSLAVALIEASYSRDPNDKREVARLQTELCAVVRQEDEGAREDSKRVQLRNQILGSLEEIATQHGADIATIRRASPFGPLGTALDLLTDTLNRGVTR